VRNKSNYRLFEISSIIVFVIITIMLVIFNPAEGVNAVEENLPGVELEAYAYAMPHRGWAPLTVYFSAFGSQPQLREIASYEWDLDGNGLYDTDASTNGGYASYTYTKPGEYLITVRVTDDTGRSSTAQTMVTVKHPSSSSVDYWTVFDDSQVRKVELQITQANWDAMWEQPELKTRVEADIFLFGDLVESVAVSMKGNGSLGGSGEKKSWKIDTDHFVAEQEYKNLKQLLFHNNFMDASMLREKMGYEMSAFAGVPAGHTAYVAFWIDIVDDENPSEYWGVYTMVERPDSKYVRNRFGDDNGTGNLYKADAWFEQGAADLAYYGGDIEGYPKPRGEVAYGLRTNKDEADYSDIIQLCYVIDGIQYESEAVFTQALEQVLNVDGYLRYTAVLMTHQNLDTYQYTGNNYFIYNDLTTGKFEFVAWDLNSAWMGNPEFPLYGEKCCQGPVQWAPLYTKVFQVARYRQDYAAYVDLLTRYWFSDNYFPARAAYWQEMVSPYLAGDKAYVGDSALYSLEQFTNERNQLVILTSQRSQYLQSLLSSGQWRTIIPEPNVDLNTEGNVNEIH
ncbi:MAG: PKD domain-containing protein, partial [Anaerolineae bacterium]|nr:PKD domain-containing protein [Anaerolineae bacterium]